MHFHFTCKSNSHTLMHTDIEDMIFQEEDEKERLSQAQEAGEDDGADHTDAAEDSFLGLSIEEVPKPQY